MMRRLSDITISTKVYGLVGLLFLFVAIVSGALIWVLRDTDARYSHLLERETSVSVEEMRIRGDLQNFGRQMNAVLLITNPPDGIDELDLSLKELMAKISASRAMIEKIDSDSAVLKTLRQFLPRIQSIAAATIAIKRLAIPDHDRAARIAWNSPEGRPLVVKVYEEIATEADARVREMRRMSVQYTSRTQTTSVFAFVIVVLGLLLTAASAFVVATLGIARPLNALRSTMSRLADQHLDAEVLGTARKDEVGAMAKALQVFKDNAIHARAMEQEQAEARKRHVEEEARAKAEAERVAAELVVGSIGAGLERLAAGDLTYRLETALPSAYEKLRSDLNAAMAHLQELLRGIRANTSGLRSGTREITQAADDLSRRTEQQAASLEQTAAALDEITGTVRKTADGAKQARDVVVQTKADAENSGKVVRGAVAAMGEIERSSQQISQIIGVIDEIAFQTNLLALNAGVEAARAGDAGRGFAVVASEVRALAQRSAEAAKEIKSLISASAQQVGSGVKLVGETGQALERIVTQINQISGVVSEIASSAQEQATGLQEINTAVNQMDQATQQNAAMVEETTAAAHSLSNQTDELVQLATRFDVGQDTPNVQSVRTIPEANKLSANRGAPRSSGSGHPSRVVTTARPALAAVNGSKGDQWEEF